MAGSLRHTQSYRRYLSPSRITVNSNSPKNEQSACVHSAVNPKGPCITTKSSSIHSLSPSCKPPVTTDHVLKRNLTNVNSRVNGFKSCQTNLYGAKNRSLDLSSLMRVVGAMNVDLPKGFPLPQKLFRKKDKVDETNNSDSAEKVNIGASSGDSKEIVNETTKTVSVEDDASNLCDKNLETEAENIVKDNVNSAVENQSAKVNSISVLREQHDLFSALEQQDASVKNYYSNVESAYQTTNSRSTVTDSSTNNSYTKSTVEGAANLVKTITNYIPGLSSQNSNEPGKDNSKVTAKKTLNKQPVVPRSVLDRKTKGLVKSLVVATSSASRLNRMEEFCRHLSAHPEAKSLAVKEKVIPCLLRLRSSKDAGLREQAMEALALVGHTDPVKGRGIRVLSIDGGGTRGLVSIEILRRLEEVCKTDIHNMFDFICGVSTGCLIGVLLGVHKVSLDEAERLYKTFSTEMFQRHKLMGVSKLVMSQGYYDAQLWEKILQENVGRKTFLESARDPNTPKTACVSTLMNLTKLSNFLFRNYNHPQGMQSQLPGSCKYALWEAVRASSAAPMYYQEFKLDEWIHQDGGIITNNPTAIAVHEAKLLWPNDPLQCVVSLGTGRYEPTAEPETSSAGIRTKITKIIQSATDTEAVHTTLNDLLPPSTYFRFNPYMSEDFTLDEIRPASWNQMTLDTQLYCRKNQHKINKAAGQLMLTKLPHQKAKDWVKSKVMEFK